MGNQAFFAGGNTGGIPVVDIYNTSTGIWSTASLSQAGYDLAATSAGAMAIFGGGINYATGNASSVVDIYNTSTNTWSTASLSVARYDLAAASAGNQVFFGGGGGLSSSISSVVDIYNTSTGVWSTANLSQARANLSATSVGNQVFFAGGINDNGSSSVVDIFNTSTGIWSTAALSQPRYDLAATSAGNQVFFAGGESNSDGSSVVNIYTLQNYGTITSSKAFTLCDQTTVTGLMQLNAPGSLVLSTFSLNVGSMSGNSPIDLGSQTLTVGSDNTSNTYSGIISDAGTLVKIGSGTLVLGANNTYTGSTSITNGTLLLAIANALSSGTPISVTGGVLNLGGLIQTTSSAVSLQSGTIQNGTIIATGPAYTFQSGIVSANLAGSAGLTKSGNGTLTLSGSNSYTGGTVVSQGTLIMSGALTGGGNVQLAVGTTLSGSGLVYGNIVGAVGSTIAATGNLALGDSTSYTGFNHAGTLTVGTNIVTLNSAGFANLGVLTTLGGGTLAAPNGVTVPLGGNLVGSGVVNGKIADGYGSTISATGNLTLGDSTSPAGFTSAGELYTGANTVTIQSNNRAVLGSLTQVGSGGNSGTLVASNGIVLDYGNNLVGQGTVSTPNTLAAASIINGNVDGTGSGLNFTGYVKGAGSFSGQVTFSGSYSIGNSPAAILMDNAAFGPSSSLIIGLAGTTAGSQYDQLDISSLATLNGVLDVDLLDGFMPSAGQSFDILNGSTTGVFSQISLPALNNGLQWNTSNLYSNGTISVVPEPSTLALLDVGAIGLLVYVSRRRWKAGGTMRRFTLRKISTTALVLAVGAALASATAHGQLIFVANSNNNTVGEYTTSGAVVNAFLVSGLSDPYGIAVSGSDLFVTNQNTGTVGEYTTSGAVVNASLVSGLSDPFGIAVSGSDLFVTNYYNNTIGEYTTSGAVVNASLVSGLHSPFGIAVSGSHLFVVNNGSESIGEYTTSGAVVNASLVSGLSYPAGVVVVGSNLYVTNQTANTIGEYTTSGAVVNASLISGVSNPYGIATSGSDLFVTILGTDSIGEYTTSGAVVNASLVSGLSNLPVAVAVMSGPITWTGGTNGSWDTSTANWAASVSSTATYSDGNAVIFNDKNALTGTNVSNTNITISGSVSPQSITFNNTGAANGGVDYTIGGGAITGTGAIIINGSGTVTLTGSNTYTGGTTISAGTLQVGNGGTTGTLPAGVTNNSVLAFDRSDAITLGGVIGGSGSLVQAGPGTLNLTGTVSNTTIVGNAGQVVLAPSLVFSGDLATGPAGRIQNNSALQFGSLNNSGIFLGGGSLLGNFINQSSGNVRIAAGQSFYIQNSAPQSNAGLIQVIGTGASQAQFESAGPFTNASGGGSGMIAAQNATLEFDGGLTNQAALAFSYGVNNVFGTITNSPSGNITIAGGAGVTFYGDVAQNGTLVVATAGSTHSSAVFLGDFSGSGGFTGGGDVFIEGDLRPSDPVEVTFGGNAYLGSSTDTVMQLAGPVAGSQYDQIKVTGQLVLAGDLDLVLLDGFQPQADESFQLFDGPLSGTFSQLTLPALGNGLSWNTSNLDTNGTISVTPEPSTLALLAAGAIGWLVYGVRRRTAARRTAKPATFDQPQDEPPILAFASHSSSASAARRAA